MRRVGRRSRSVIGLRPNGKEPAVGSKAQERRGGIFIAASESLFGPEVQGLGSIGSGWNGRSGVVCGKRETEHERN